MTKIQLKAEPFHKHATAIVCKVDTGAEVDVISEANYKQSCPTKQPAALAQHNFLHPMGASRFKLWEAANSVHTTIFTVTDAPGPAIVGCKKCKELDLINVNCSLESSEEKGVYTPLTSESLISDLWRARKFHMKSYHILLHPEAEPAFHAPRAVRDLLHMIFNLTKSKNLVSNSL